MADNNLAPSRVQGVNRTLFKDTLSRALLAEDGKLLRKLSERLIDMAISPSLTPSEQLAAIKLIIERVDGKPREAPVEGLEDQKPTTGLFKIVKVE